jgi:hypothetical protein
LGLGGSNPARLPGAESGNCNLSAQKPGNPFEPMQNKRLQSNGDKLFKDGCGKVWLLVSDALYQDLDILGLWCASME